MTTTVPPLLISPGDGQTVTALQISALALHGVLTLVGARPLDQLSPAVLAAMAEVCLGVADAARDSADALDQAAAEATGRPAGQIDPRLVKREAMLANVRSRRR